MLIEIKYTGLYIQVTYLSFKSSIDEIFRDFNNVRNSVQDFTK